MCRGFESPQGYFNFPHIRAPINCIGLNLNTPNSIVFYRQRRKKDESLRVFKLDLKRKKEIIIKPLDKSSSSDYIIFE